MIDPDDLPYGPGNPDYEYDRYRDERDDAERERQRAEQNERQP